MKGIEELVREGTAQREDCYCCKESRLAAGKKTEYGSVVVFRIGKGATDGWFATLSPKTGGDPEKDFTLQLMPFGHLTHFSQMALYPELAKNYGIAFSRLCNAMATVMAKQEKEFGPTAESRETAVSIATYGKCTNWVEKKEHLHVKIFPFRGNTGQPYTVDSSFGKKKIFTDSETGERFVKMSPVGKVEIPKKRFEALSAELIAILSGGKK